MDNSMLPELTNAQIRGLENSHRNGARIFLIISGVSLLNILGLLFNFPSALLAGLGSNFYINGFGESVLRQISIEGNGASILLFIVNLMIIGGFTSLGFLAYRRHLWAYNLGMILYALDTLIYFRVWAWSGIIFHALGLLLLFLGHGPLVAILNLKKAGRVPSEIATTTGVELVPAETFRQLITKPVSQEIPSSKVSEPFDWKMVRSGILVFVLPILIVGFVLWLILPK